MERFKVGDRVVCTKHQRLYNVDVGEIGVIVKIDSIGYYVDFQTIDWWPMSENEIAHYKEYQVLTILRNYKNEKGISKLP